MLMQVEEEAKTKRNNKVIERETWDGDTLETDKEKWGGREGGNKKNEN